MAGNKPYTSNGTISDPREQDCWDNFVKNNLENAYQSALSAGYSDDSARNITTRDWFKERLGRLKRKDMLSKAERNLDKVLDFKMKDEEGKVITPIASLVVGVSTTIVKTLGKDDGYSERSELTGKDGEKLEIIVTNYMEDGETKPKEKSTDYKKVL